MNKIVLITGSATGIGKACAEKFAQNKDIIILHYNKSEKDATKLAEKLSKITQVDLIKADLTNEQEIAKMFNLIQKKHKKLDILINNAGISFEKMLIEMSCDEITKMISTNLTAPILCSKEACELMLANGGNIINISSIYGLWGGSCEAVYSATKAGLIGLTKALSREMGDANIKVNAIAPGAIDTKMNKNFTQEQQEDWFKNSGIKRMGLPQEIANTAFFLASDEASYITGQTIVVDGGTI